MNEIEQRILDTDLLRTFVAIANWGNLTVAAGQLGRTQSAISVQLRKLETEMGVRLFERDKKGMTLTPQGEILLPKARSLLAEIRKTGALFAEPLTGSIRVGLPDDFEANLLEKILTDFGKTHPGVHVVASSGCTSGYPKAIRNDALDIAVYSSPENIEGTPLCDERTVWAARFGFKIDRDTPVPLAILERNCWWRDAPIHALDQVGRDYTIAFRSSSFASLQTAIRSGFAVGILPDSSQGPDTIELQAKDGFPDLPNSRRSIVVAPSAPANLTEAMALAIRQAWHEHSLDLPN